MTLHSVEPDARITGPDGAAPGGRTPSRGRGGDSWALLEVVEPSLYLGLDDRASDRFVAAVRAC